MASQRHDQWPSEARLRIEALPELPEQSEQPSAPPLFDDDDNNDNNDSINVVYQNNERGRVVAYNPEKVPVIAMTAPSTTTETSPPTCVLCNRPVTSAIVLYQCGHRVHLDCAKRPACPKCGVDSDETKESNPASVTSVASVASVASVSRPDVVDAHVLEHEDYSLDELKELGRSAADIAALDISWTQALRLGLRRDHFCCGEEPGWLWPPTPRLFAGMTALALRKQLQIGVADLIAGNCSINCSGSRPVDASDAVALGLTIADVPSRELFLASPYTLRDWKLLGATPHALRRLLLTRDDFRRTLRDRGWNSQTMGAELGYARRDLEQLGLIVPLSNELQLPTLLFRKK